MKGRLMPRGFVEVQVKRDGDSQRRQRDGQREPTCKTLAEQKDGGSSCQGQKGRHAEDRERCHKPKTASAMAARMPMAMISP